MTSTPGAPPPPPPRREMTDSERRNWAMVAHLSALIAFAGVPSLIGPLVVWLIKRDEDEFVAAHSLHALNFNISVLVYLIVGSLALGILGLITLGLGFLLAIPVVLIAFVFWVVYVIQASLAASRGEGFHYPLTIDWVS